MATTVRRFPSPFEIQTPPGAEGWESMYPPYILFSEDNREWEEGRFWFLDSLHRPEVEYPFDTIVHEAWNSAASELVTRTLAVPVTNGYVERILNGRLYLTILPVPDQKVVEERVPIYTRRAGHYFENWADLFERWRGKLERVIGELKAIQIPRLPHLEDESVVTEARGYSTGLEMLNAYQRT